LGFPSSHDPRSIPVVAGWRIEPSEFGGPFYDRDVLSYALGRIRPEEGATAVACCIGRGRRGRTGIVVGSWLTFVASGANYVPK